MMSTMLANADTSSRILDVAEHLVQTRGFNAFSYADIADDLGVTKASLHYHFPTKANLGERLIERYQDAFMAALDEIERHYEEAGAKLEAYMALYEDVLNGGRMCLCGMLASDFATLPEPMKLGLQRFFVANETWLSGVLRHGRERGQIAFSGRPADMARFIVSTLEGAMLLARARPNNGGFRSVIARLLDDFGVSKPKISSRRDRSS